MAIFHCSTKVVSRGKQQSAVAAAAYRAGCKLIDERIDSTFDYSRKQGVLHSEIITPEGIPVPDRETLWNSAERIEKRKDARVAREWRIALPEELGSDARKELALAFGKLLSNKFGIAVDVCVHAPDGSGDDRNFHAHLLSTTRKISVDGSLNDKSDIELENAKRNSLGMTTTQKEISVVRKEWEILTNLALDREGHSVRIDCRSYKDQGIELEPTVHIGPDATEMHRRGLEAERFFLNEEIRAKQAEQIRNKPSIIIDKITSVQAVFTRRDIAKELNRYIDDSEEFQLLLLKIEQSPELVQLEEEQGRFFAKYSTREMIETEHDMVSCAESLFGVSGHASGEQNISTVMDGLGTLSAEQKWAIAHVTGAKDLAVVIGDAGTGKSFCMKAAKEIWEAEGYRVLGTAITGKAAEELKDGSGIDSRTLASMEFQWKLGINELSKSDILVIDEAGMIGSRQMKRILEKAKKAGAKVVLLGDSKQLSAIEAGAPLRSIVDRIGCAEITHVRRQKHEWMRKVSNELARGDVGRATCWLSDNGCLKKELTREEAIVGLAKDWVQWQVSENTKGEATSIVLAHSNKDVTKLNLAIREELRARGGLDAGGEIIYQTERGEKTFAVGDRLVFLKNDRELGVTNGTIGIVSQAINGRLSVAIVKDKEARIVAVNADEYKHFDHGYAVTIHKSQGLTVDKAYLLATPSMDRSLFYVGLTRHRDDVKMFYGTDDFQRLNSLLRAMALRREKLSTLDFAVQRGFDGEKTIRGWIKRSWEKVEQVVDRMQALWNQVEGKFQTKSSVALEKEVEQPIAVKESISARQLSEVSTKDLAKIEERVREDIKHFKTSALGRVLGACDYRNDGDEWLSFPQEMKDRIEAFNKIPKSQQEAALKSMKEEIRERYIADPMAVERGAVWKGRALSHGRSRSQGMEL